jgi:hypothetical protein
MENFVKLLTGIAWPLAIVWVALLFKTQLRHLIDRISQVKYGGVEANFHATLKVAEATSLRIEKDAPATALPTPPEIATRLDQLRRIATVSPRAAIMEAWLLIEEAAGQSGYIQGASIPRVNVFLFVEALIREYKLPAESGELVTQMRELRNRAAHVISDFELSQSEADRYLELAAKVSTLILSA